MKSISALIVALCLTSVLSTSQFSAELTFMTQDINDVQLNAEFIAPAVDLRTFYPECGWPISEEGLCASSWAIAVADTISSYACIQSETNWEGSVQQILDCVEPSASSCVNVTGLVNFEEALNYIGFIGLTTSACYPYSSQFVGSVTQQCQARCSDDSPFPSLVKPTGYNQVSVANVAQIQLYIGNDGPAMIAYNFYDDLLHYKGGVYQTAPGARYLGVHYGQIVGYGTNSNGVYYIVSNSWGSFWGMNGYFQIYANDANVQQIWTLTGTTLINNSV